MKRRRKKKRMEMSKILLIVSDMMVLVTLIFSFMAIFKMMDVSPLTYLIPGVFGLASVAHGFYFWKAKAENINKFKMSGQDPERTELFSEDEIENFPKLG